ncbi:glucosamine-6-phosphate deaminase [Agrococcus baldri]|uniref:Glucosamine-6-phosphate deaminase n=1 Tax=Agrococcus baldri TaxID=153730 RepID=A0AA94HKR8_9MICO|nr:glucosamine-6-phosphate deaminase [Agrococcus baldri]SFS01785.1 glucosamine-6-phosphate deaminase [Agrococcus baldri]
MRAPMTPTIRLAIARSPHELATLAADAVVEALPGDRAPVLGVATGSSPSGVYVELARRQAAGEIDLRDASAFALDEYVGLPDGDPHSYRTVVREQVIEPLGLDPARVHVPDGTAADLAAECASYEQRITAAGGVDVQILGLGRNGHIAFNEPGSALDSRTREAELAPETIADNARFFDSPDQVPRRCVTQGVGTILDARRIVLVAQGEAKADALAHALEDAVSPAWPATALQQHADVIVIVDEAAASRLSPALRESARR